MREAATRTPSWSVALVAFFLAVLVAVLALAASYFAEPAWAKVGSNFATTCDLAAFTTDSGSHVDPIFEPADHSHEHLFFGAPLVTNDDTGDSLRGDQPTSCNRPVNSSAYWMPQVYRNGKPLKVDTFKDLGDNTIYYQAGAIKPLPDPEAPFAHIEPFPRDFEMVARDSGPGDVKWTCLNSGNRLVENPNSINKCISRKLTMRITFPQCWNGLNVPEADNLPDVVMNVPASGSCSDLPITELGEEWQAVPQISMSLEWLLPRARVGTIRVATDDGLGLASTMHADFVNAWQHETIDTTQDPALVGLDELVRECIQTQGQDAGLDSKPTFCQDPHKRNLAGRSY